MKSITPIKDIIHGYMPFSPVEKIVIDSRYFQRLHFVLQNSAAYTAFPNNKNSRFEHSLGVAHLAGLIFQHAMNNANDDSFTTAIKQMNRFAELHCSRYRYGTEALPKHWLKHIGYQFTFSNNDLRVDKNPSSVDTKSYDPLFLLNSFGIALRVCGLIHDIGHLPMSHIFEEALQNAQSIFDLYDDDNCSKKAFKSNYEHLKSQIFTQSRDSVHHRHDFLEILNIGKDNNLVTRQGLNRYIRRMPIHERRGVQIFDLIYYELEQHPKAVLHEFTNDSPVREYVFFLFDIATRIIFGDPLLHGIASGKKRSTEDDDELERFFVCLRDIISSVVDADRIDYTLRDPISSGVPDRRFDVNQIVSNFVFHRDPSTNEFRLCLGYKALPDLELMFHNRYWNYKYIINHHSVTRMNAVLEEIIKQFIRLCYVQPCSGISKLLGDFGLVNLESKKKRLLPHLESRILDDTWLRSMLLKVREHVQGREQEGDDTLHHLKVLIETFLFRITNNMKTAWKSEIDYRLAIADSGDSHITDFGSVSLREKIRVVEEVVAKAKCKIDSISIFLKFPEAKVYQPRKDERFRIIDTRDGRAQLWKVAELSAYLRGLQSISRRSLNFHLSFCAENLRTNVDLRDACERLEKDLFDVLVDVRKNSQEY